MLMKKVIQWLAKVFNANITVEKVVVVEKETIYYLPQNGTIDGDVRIKGDLIVTGYVAVSGSLSCKEIFNN